MSRALRGRVAVVQPATQHAYETAAGLEEAGLLEAYVTGLYNTGRGLTDPRLLRLAPQRVRRLAGRRAHPEICANRVKSMPLYHTVSTALRRGTGNRGPIGRSAERWARTRFDRAAGRWIAGADLDAVHAFEGCAITTFAAAKAIGATTVLDVPSAHEYHKRVVLEEGGDVGDYDTDRTVRERAAADHLLVPSDFVRRCLVENGVPNDRISLVQYGVDPVAFRPGCQRRPVRLRVLYVGRIGLGKGVGYLLEAWRRLHLADAELVLVGPADDEGRSVLAPYRDICTWVGAVSKADVAEWYRASDVFVFPSLAEGSASVLLEAMASGLPIVTTESAGAVFDDGDGGIVVPSRDVDRLAEAIARMCSDRALRRETGARARDLVESDFTWQHYRLRLLAFYAEQVMGSALTAQEVEARAER